MSNIYVQEPPALGKILLKTTVGDIDLELWTKETPKACRNFVQLCMEGYYNGTIFHRVVPDFIVQGGDPNGDGTGGESVYGQPFKDEFHSRLRFNRRGLVAMANAGKDDNSSQFFFTLNSTPELQNKHTIFGKVTGETIYNMLKLAEGETDLNEKPLYPHKIIACQVLVNPFDDITPRISEKPKEIIEKKKKKEKGVKNIGLLSFGMEAEEDEDQISEFRGKPKSTHDLLDDPKLSKLTALEGDMEYENKLDTSISQNIQNEEETQATLDSIKDKLKSKKKKKSKVDDIEDVKSDEEIESYYLGKDKKEARKKQAEEIREQIKDLKKEMSGKKRAKEAEKNVQIETEKEKLKPSNEVIEQYENEQEKYKNLMKQIPKKGASRETQEKIQDKKPWVKKLYENTGIYPDNYTDKKFLEEMKKNINIHNISFNESVLGSCRITQKLSACILFSIIFAYLYNEWTSAESVFTTSILFSMCGYFLFLLVDRCEMQKEEKKCVGSYQNIEKADVKDTNLKSNHVNDDEKYVNQIFDSNIERKSKKVKKNEKFIYIDKNNHRTSKSDFSTSFTLRVFNDFKTVLIYLFFGYLFSPILHTLTDTVSTDTIFATTIFMMVIHLIFSDYGISVAVVSNSLSINCAIFGSICLASRLSNPFCAFVLMTVAIQVFVLSPILIKLVWDSNYSVLVYGAFILTSFYFLWVISKTLFCFYLLAILFLNVYCPHLFVKWQMYKDNIYGPWDEAVVHDSDNVEDLIS